MAHAIKLIMEADPNPSLDQAGLRRAVSALYYGLFHKLNEDAVALIAPNVPARTNHRIRRWFDHTEMKKICARFLPRKLEQPLRDLIGDSASSELQTVALSFIQLQELRHQADYDLSFRISQRDALKQFHVAADAIEAWRGLAGTPEANIFILSLLLWKNWEKDRP